MTDSPLTDIQLDLDAIQAKATELRERLNGKNPWPSDNESHWMTNGWRNGTRNALDKLHVEALVAEVHRLGAENAELRSENAKLIRWHREDETALNEMRGTIVRLRAQPPMICIDCETPVGWVDCPTGGWWAHETHPADGHDAAARPAPTA